MNGYSIALFVHIVGALGFFVALGLEWVSLRSVWHATTNEQVRTWINLSAGLGRLGMVAMVALLASGFYMMAIARIGAAWLIVSFWALVLLALLAVTLSRPRMAALGRAALAEEGNVSASFHHMLRQPLLWIVLQTRVAGALGIVFLMTVKPNLSGSLLAMGVALVLGLAAALPRLGRKRAHEGLVT